MRYVIYRVDDDDTIIGAVKGVTGYEYVEPFNYPAKFEIRPQKIRKDFPNEKALFEYMGTLSLTCEANLAFDWCQFEAGIELELIKLWITGKTLQKKTGYFEVEKLDSLAYMNHPGVTYLTALKLWKRHSKKPEIKFYTPEEYARLLNNQGYPTRHWVFAVLDGYMKGGR